ncbi:UDP-glucosyltransferase 2 [Anabrus simplex]|uniref:UDP-glucosyltransferase 2 n=1 Tax=Anabrus simplex TaxID=316456 RepID=UPI0034DCD06F
MAGPRCLWDMVFFVVLAVSVGNCARILMLAPVPSKSHLISFSALTKELARRGHQVTVVSGFPIKPPIANYTDITIDSSFPENVMPNLFTMNEEKFTLRIFTMMWDVGLQICERALKHPNVQSLIEDKVSQFDLVILAPCLIPTPLGCGWEMELVTRTHLRTFQTSCWDTNPKCRFYRDLLILV